MNQTSPEPAEMADDMLFADEAETADIAARVKWKVLIADDEPDVHLATKLVLKEFSFKDRGIEFLDAYSGKETCEILQFHPDTAVVFLDVVMETDDAGLRTVKRIRDELGNHMVRIILRTGQPGQAPEEDVVVNYHINDYKSKAEMTTKKLFTSLVSALRSFQDLQTIEASRRGLVKVLDAASNMDFRSRSLFVSGLLMHLGSLLDIGENDLILIRRGEAGRPDTIMAACGGYDAFVGEPIRDVLDSESESLVARVFAEGSAHADGKRSIYLIPLPDLSDVAVYVGGSKKFSETELALIEIFCMKIVLAYENFEFVEQSRLDQAAEIALLAKVTGHASYLPLAYVINRGRLSREIALQMREQDSSGVIAGRLPELLERAAMLADIGNFAVPASVLEAAAPLSAADLALVRQHPELGATLLQDVLAEVSGGRVASLVQEVAVSHHENFDGSGYPHGLVGERISLSGRIVAVADGYMALTSARPWRAAVTHAEALAVIRREAGKKYDPQVVESFVVVADAFRQPV